MSTWLPVGVAAKTRLLPWFLLYLYHHAEDISKRRGMHVRYNDSRGAHRRRIGATRTPRESSRTFRLGSTARDTHVVVVSLDNRPIRG